ncbi:MAG: hypothetical protein GF333_05530 [Candidatus Omnitrophica bacterium]|nr:hypothetical protein [Candidatus Omnitrophota bacterium]
MDQRSIYAVLMIMLIMQPGCHSLRKKFIRKKKTESQEQVYVSFKNYPQAPSREAYIDYYLFVRGWLDELIQALDRGDSFKRRKRAIGEARMNLEQIMSFFSSEGKDLLYPLFKTIVEVQEEIERYPNMSEMKRRYLIHRIEHFQRQFALQFTYEDAKQWME